MPGLSAPLWEFVGHSCPWSLPAFEYFVVRVSMIRYDVFAVARARLLRSFNSLQAQRPVAYANLIIAFVLLLALTRKGAGCC